MARVFENAVALVFVQRERHSPGPGIDVRILDGGFVLNRVLVHACQSFDDPRRLAQLNAAQPARGCVSGNPSLAIEIVRFDHERVALPMSARIAVPRPHAWTECRTAAERNHPALRESSPSGGRRSSWFE